MEKLKGNWIRITEKEYWARARNNLKRLMLSYDYNEKRDDSKHKYYKLLE